MNIDKIITEAIDNLVNEADRHREGYWKERWAKQKSEKEKNDNINEKYQSLLTAYGKNI